ncbi:class I SAM-dependent methyltransferase [Streptomyces sp. NPDC059070]|uniref:class I SAM-dependent methyltransferase n=1 Tax=Streptomyces sp. NPDC059070 TaxID=3346713 RepID=UPI0036A5BBE3
MAEAKDKAGNPEYGLGLLGHQIPSELRRLRALEEFADPITRTIISGLGIDSGWHCLELGGGAGSIARWMAERCAHGEVVVTDIDTHLLPREVPNLSVLKHDVMHDDFPPASFDVVHARALLEHLPAREEAIARMAGWTVPGGWVFVEGVIVISSSGRHALQRCMNALIALSSRMQTDLGWATELPRLLGEAGLDNIGVRCTPGLVGRNSNANELLRLTFEQTGPTLVEQGLTTRSDLAACMALLDDGDHTHLAYLILSTWGQRARNRPHRQ